MCVSRRLVVKSIPFPPLAEDPNHPMRRKAKAVAGTLDLTAPSERWSSKRSGLNGTAVLSKATRRDAAPLPAAGCTLRKSDFAHFLKSMSAGSADLLLTDPPYCISRKTGFSSLGANSVERFAVSMDFGKWDHAEIDLDSLACNAYRILRKGGTAIVFYDVWKLTTLANALTAAGFVQLRLIEWMKTNPVPLNSKRNYLTNSREIAVLAVKSGKPTFNSEYDNGQYHHPIPNNGSRYHPTQKPLRLFQELVQKHSKPGDLVVDPFVGSGTTAVAAVQHRRRFAGCDIDSDYLKIARKRVRDVSS